MNDLAPLLLMQLPDVSDFGVVVVAPDGRINLWNRWMEAASGIPREDALGKPLTELFPDIAGTRLASAIETALERGLSSLLTPALNKVLFPLLGKDGRTPVTQMVAIKPLADDNGAHHCFIQVTDITEAAAREVLLRQQARRMETLAENHRQSELRTRAIVDSAIDAIITFDGAGEIITFNPAAERIFGHPVENIVGEPIKTVLPVCGDQVLGGPAAAAEAWSKMAQTQSIRECTGRRIDGTDIDLELSIGTMIVEDQRLFVATARDITLRKQAEARVQYLAHYDSLTDLPNRVLFQERIGQALLQAKRTGRQVALMMLDLDKFKEVNDTLGHHVGDLLLKAAAERIQGSVRESDTVARLGGDEFAVILTNLGSTSDAGHIAEAIVTSVAEPFELEKHELRTSVSVGISIFSNGDDNPEDLLKHADLALYRAKAKGRNTYEFYVPQMDAMVQAHKEMERELRRALRREELSLEYQPLVDAESGTITAVEALLRWDHGNRGHLDAGDFIPMVRDTEVIVPVGNWVIRHACTQTREWLDAGLQPARISVNMAALELCHERFVSELADALGQARLEPSMLQLEFTEEALLLVADRAPGRIEKLRDIGVRLSIDDFGSGASSLDYLKRHPVDQLKIDPSFLKKAGTTPNGSALFASMVELGHSIGATIDVEGVETQDQLDLVRRLGVEDMQGFFLCRPLPAEGMGKVLRAGSLIPG